MSGWIPCSAFETKREMLWLPRLVEKARQYRQSLDTGRDCMNSYLFGNNDVIDAEFLRFLRIDDRDVLALVRKHPSDDAVIEIIVARSELTPDQRSALSARMRRKYFNFELTEADEGRTSPGLRRSLIRFFYTRLMMPMLTMMYPRAERKRWVALPS